MAIHRRIAEGTPEGSGGCWPTPRAAASIAPIPDTRSRARRRRLAQMLAGKDVITAPTEAETSAAGVEASIRHSRRRAAQ